MNDLEEALRSELRDRAEAADREISLLEPVACRVSQARRRCALAALALTAIVGLGVAASVPAWTILQPTRGTAALDKGSPVTRHKLAATKQLAVAKEQLAAMPKPGIVAGLLNWTEQAVVHKAPVSLQAVLLAQERHLAVPVGWHWHDFGGIRFAAPASWVIEREGLWNGCPYGVAPMTVLLNIESLQSVFGCGKPPLAATSGLAGLFSTGVVVDAGRYAAAEIESAPTVAPYMWLGGMRMCVLQPGTNGMPLKVAVYPSESASPILVEIGLGSYATAKTIFDSIGPPADLEHAKLAPVLPALRGERPGFS